MLAVPFHNPLQNMLVQGWLTCFAALLAPFLVSRSLRVGPHWFAMGALANVFIVLILSPVFQFDWFVTQPYAVSMSLAFAGLLVSERAGITSQVVATLLMLLAHWVNLGVFIVIVPFILARRGLLVRSLPLVAVGAMGGLLLRRLSPAPPTTLALVPSAQWPTAWFQLLRTVSRTLVHPEWFAILVVLGVGSSIVLTLSGRARQCTHGAAIAIIVAIVHWLLIGMLEHVQRSDYYPRYLLPSLVLVVVAMSVILVGSFNLIT